MKHKKIIANDRSRNGHSTETSKRGNSESLNLLESIVQYTRESNYDNRYPLDVLEKFFHMDINIASYFKNIIPHEQSLVNEIFGQIADSLSFNTYLQRKMVEPSL